MFNEPAVIAVVDDDAPLRNALDNLIRSFGLKAIEFSSAEEFLARGACESVDVVVTDYRMPGMSGLGLLKSLRDRSIGLPVIIISAHADEEFCDRAISDGAFACLAKPFDEEALISVISRSLGLD